MKWKPLPTEFVLAQCTITWREAHWGLTHGLIGRSFLVELAMREAEAGTDSRPLLLELAGLYRDELEDAPRIAAALAGESEPEPLITKKWLYLVLLWVFYNRQAFEDPLGVAEDIYCDFGHPKEMATFIRYMPPPDEYDPLLHTKVENEQRMFQSWDTYLANSREALGIYLQSDEGSSTSPNDGG